MKPWLRNILWRKPEQPAVSAHVANTSLRDIFESVGYGSDFGRTPYGSPAYAMREAVVYLCVGRIVGAISQLELDAKTRDGDGLYLDAPGDRVTYLLNREPHPLWSAPEFWDYMVQSVELYGNAYAHIKRNMGGVVQSIKPFAPQSVTPMIDGDRIGYQMVDQLPSYNNRGSGNVIHAPGRDVIHFKNMTQDGLKGISTLSAAASSLDYKYWMDRFSRTFYQRGLHSQVAIGAEQAFTEEDAKYVKEQFLANARDTREALAPIVLGKNAKIMQLGISPRDALLIELEEFRSVEIARAFGVPDVLLNMAQKVQAVGKATDEIVRFFGHFTIKPKLNRMQAELSRKLAPLGKKEYKFRFEAKGSLGDEVAALSTALGGQPWMTINEARQRAGLPKLDGEEYDTPRMMPGTPGGGPGMPQNPGDGDDAPIEPGDGEDDDQVQQRP